MDWNLDRFLSVILFTSTILVPATTDCPEYTYNIGSKQFTLQRAPSSYLWIASDCLDANKLLIFRRCENDNWIPNDNIFEYECTFENVELSSKDCPHESMALQIQVPSPKPICVLNHSGIRYNFLTDKSVCIEDSISTMDTELNIDKETELIAKLDQEFAKYVFPLGARNRYPTKEISKNVNYEIEDVELHDVRCGRFGLPLKFNNTVPVYCSEEVCDNMCLSVNTKTDPFSRMIQECTDYVIAKPKDSFLHEIGCPSGYYRTESDYIQTGKPDACFSIQMFPEPIPVKDLEKFDVIESFCNGTIMTLNWKEDMFVFKKLSEKFYLTDGNHCLFGITPNQILKFSDWNATYASEINLFNFNWDKTMNYSRIKNVDEEVSYLAVKPNGQWTWTVDSVSCIVCTAEVPIPIAKLQLKYNILERKLELDVTDQEFLYRARSSDPGFICFSVYKDIYKANLTVTPVADSVGKYVVEDVGTGQYWCNGHNVIRRLYISSEIIFAYGVWFAFEVVRKCDSDCSSSGDDLSQFISLFQRSNAYVSIKDSLFVEHKTREGDPDYTFTAHLSLTSFSPISFKLLTNLANLTEHELETIYIYDSLNKTLPGNDAGFSIKSIRSTEYCLHEWALSTDGIIWKIAKIGQTVEISPLCHPQNITRSCVGDYVYGSYWEEPVGIPNCDTDVTKTLLELYVDINKSFQTATIVENVKNLLKDNLDIVLPIDVFVTSQILQKVGNVTSNELQNIYSIFDSLMRIDENILKVSASVNSTNILLEAFDNILMNRLTHTITSSSEYELYGHTSIHFPLIETYIFDPRITHICGLALFRPRAAGDADVEFTIYSPLFIHAIDETDKLMNEKLANKDLVIGAKISKAILDAYKNMTVAMTVFFNDKLFQSIDEASDRTFAKSNKKVISVTIAGLYDYSNLPSKFHVYFESQRNEEPNCGFWSFTSVDSWSSDVCEVREVFSSKFQQLTLCECSYSTHFGYIVDDIFENDNSLSIITALTASFPLLGTFGIFLTAVVFPRWRQETSSKILINFAASITLEMVLAIWISFNNGSVSVIESDTLNCFAVGIMLHYCVMVMFLWMLILVYFQFSRYVVVFKFSVSHLLLKLSLWIWVVPLLPLLAVILADRSLYLHLRKDHHKFCHPTGWALYFGVISPITIIFVVVSIVIIAALIDLRRRSSNATSQIEAEKFRVGLCQIKLSAFLFLTLGLTWSCGLFSYVIAEHDLVHSYLFCVTATVKGIVLIVYFTTLFDGSVGSLWLNYFRKKHRCRNARE